MAWWVLLVWVLVLVWWTWKLSRAALRLGRRRARLDADTEALHALRCELAAERLNQQVAAAGREYDRDTEAGA